MSHYIIYHYNILDREKIAQLGPLSLPIVKKFGGQLVIGSNVSCLEGSSYTHMVAYTFSDKDSAYKFYTSAESRELSKLRNEITEGVVIMVPEYPAFCG